jgi:hypothetical protein
MMLRSRMHLLLVCPCDGKTLPPTTPNPHPHPLALT